MMQKSPMPRIAAQHGPAGGAIAVALKVLGLALSLSACTHSVIIGPPDGDVLITLDVRGAVREPSRRLLHARDNRHTCMLPARVQLGPARPEQQAPNHVRGYSVVYGPDFPLPSSDGVTLAPEWIGYGSQTTFSLEVFPLPDELGGTGPVRLGRSFRITVSAGNRLWERTVHEEDAAEDARVTIDAGGRTGSFRVPGLLLQLPHNRAPEDMTISVAGRWRCPAG